jgi:hypothetical protein
MGRAKKVTKVSGNLNPVVKRREALPFSELLGAYKALNYDCTIAELADKLNRPQASVYQRFNVLRKALKEQGKGIKPLKRRRKKVADKVSPLMEQYADIMSALEPENQPES